MQEDGPFVGVGPRSLYGFEVNRLRNPYGFIRQIWLEVGGCIEQSIGEPLMVEPKAVPGLGSVVVNEDFRPA